jgi:hypothetical protein
LEPGLSPHLALLLYRSFSKAPGQRPRGRSPPPHSPEGFRQMRSSCTADMSELSSNRDRCVSVPRQSMPQKAQLLAARPQRNLNWACLHHQRHLTNSGLDWPLIEAQSAGFESNIIGCRTTDEWSVQTAAAHAGESCQCVDMYEGCQYLDMYGKYLKYFTYC